MYPLEVDPFWNISRQSARKDTENRYLCVCYDEEIDLYLYPFRAAFLLMSVVQPPALVTASAHLGRRQYPDGEYEDYHLQTAYQL